MQKGADISIPLAVNLHIERFSGGFITRKNSGSKNLVYDQYEDGRWFAMQRPGFNQLEDASDTIADERGRGGYFWDAVSDKYIANAGTLYKSSYAGTQMTALTDGTQRVYMEKVGDYLLIVDQENNEGFTIASGAPTTLNAIADLDFPPNQTPALQLARGGAVLNGKGYVLTTGGDIYECDVEDPTSWGALSFRNAEAEPDPGVYLAKHERHIVVFGSRSLEFFQDTANATGSTLTPREDIQYDVGAIDADCVWPIGDRLYFVGQDESGGIGVYVLDGFSLRKVSEPDLDSFLTTAITVDGVGVTVCGLVSGGREFLSLTLHNTVTDLVPTLTLVHTRGKVPWWGEWDLQLPGVTLCPLVAWMPSNNTRAGEGMLINGDLVTIVDDFNPVDTVNASAVYEAGVYEGGVYSATGGSGTAIPWEIITGQFDGGTSRNKYFGDMWVEHTPIAVSEDITLAVADEQNHTYDTHGTVDASDPDDRYTRMGSARRRNHLLSGMLTEQIRLERLRGTARAVKR